MFDGRIVVYSCPVPSLVSVCLSIEGVPVVVAQFGSHFPSSLLNGSPYFDLPGYSTQKLNDGIRFEHGRRVLEQDEVNLIKKDAQKWVPPLFTNMGTPLRRLKAHSIKNALLPAIPAGLMGAGKAIEAGLEGPQVAVGAGLAAAVVGSLVYFFRNNRNESIQYKIERTPVKDPCIGDWEAQPQQQAKLNRDAFVNAHRQQGTGAVALYTVFQLFNPFNYFKYLNPFNFFKRNH
jgi:hypothetical protein